jgi:hypothetical protein
MARLEVAWSMVFVSASASSLFGQAERENGHRRVPLPLRWKALQDGVSSFFAND